MRAKLGLSETFEGFVSYLIANDKYLINKIWKKKPRRETNLAKIEIIKSDLQKVFF